MKIQNNFVSIVTLGHFNPSILTQDFLKKECGLGFREEGKEKPRSPVFTRINYTKVEFKADLGRLQITERDIEEPGNSKVAEYLRIYLEKLSYTPVFASGVNINITISGADVGSFIEMFMSRKDRFFGLLGTNEYEFEATSIRRRQGEEYTRWRVHNFLQKDRASETIDLHRIDITSCRLNYNYEVENLLRNKVLLQRITEGFGKIVERYEKVISNICGGVSL